MGKISIPTPIGNLEYEWDKTIKDPNANKKLVLNIIRSFIIGLDCGEDLDPIEIDQLLKKIKAYGHLGKFKEEEIEDYKKLVKISKKLKITKVDSKKQILVNIIQEIEKTNYNSSKFIIEKAKRIIAGMFGNDSQQYQEYSTIIYWYGSLDDYRCMENWKNSIKEEMISKITSYIAELDLL